MKVKARLSAPIGGAFTDAAFTLGPFSVKQPGALATEGVLVAYEIAPDGTYADVTIEIPDASPAAAVMRGTTELSVGCGDGFMGTYSDEEGRTTWFVLDAALKPHVLSDICDTPKRPPSET